VIIFILLSLQILIKLKYRLTAKLETTKEYLIIEGELGGNFTSITTTTNPLNIAALPPSSGSSAPPPSSGYSPPPPLKVLVRRWYHLILD